MREIVYNTPERFIAWAESRIPGCRFRSDAKSIGVLRDGNIAAAAVFDTFSTSSCFMHLASDGSRTWASREFLIRMFAYPFIQCGHTRTNAIVSSLNPQSIRIVQHMGAVQEGIWRQAGSLGEDVIMFGMLRNECRFIPKLQAST